MTNGEQFTGTRDEHYNLVSVLYHTLQEGETIERYISDARQAGDDELVRFFQCCPPPAMNMAATSNVETAVGRP
jgi:hypothetical protein